MKKQMAKAGKAKASLVVAARKPKMPKAPPQLPHPWVKVTNGAVSRSKLKAAGMIPQAFDLSLSAPPPGVIPRDIAKHTSGKQKGKPDIMAFDELVIEANAWAAQQVYNGAYFNGVTFLGYTYLSELAQRPEYRRIVEVLATTATKNWIKFNSTSDDKKSKAERIKQLTAECKRLGIQDAFRKKIELDGFFGRAHLYLDTGDTDNRQELVMSIGDGRDATTKLKFAGRTGFLKAVKPIEPVWCYPAKYEASDPLKRDWYNPQSWFVQGKEVHVTRLLTSVSREVPDMLKPSYAFGGLSLTQMAKPYVDNWLRTRQSVADLVWSFSVRGLKTNMSAMMGVDGQELFNRAAFFSNVQNNQGTMILDKDTEDFFNIQTSLATLDALQAQSQEQMCSVSATPVVVLLGIQPAGLNASSDGEIRTWDAHVQAFQQRFLTPDLDTVLDFVMLSLWGEVDPDITYEYEPLRNLSAKEESDRRKTDADTDAIYVELGVLEPLDIRKKLAADPGSPYDGLDVDDGLGMTPEELAEELENGTGPNGFGPREQRQDRTDGRRQDEDADANRSRIPADRNSGRALSGAEHGARV